MAAFTGEVCLAQGVLKRGVDGEPVLKWVLLMRTIDGRDVWLYVSGEVCEKYHKKLEAKQRAYATFFVKPEKFKNTSLELMEL